MVNMIGFSTIRNWFIDLWHMGIFKDILLSCLIVTYFSLLIGILFVILLQKGQNGMFAPVIRNVQTTTTNRSIIHITVKLICSWIFNILFIIILIS